MDLKKLIYPFHGIIFCKKLNSINKNKVKCEFENLLWLKYKHAKIMVTINSWQVSIKRLGKREKKGTHSILSIRQTQIVHFVKTCR
jgi:hypothetical protein